MKNSCWLIYVLMLSGSMIASAQSPSKTTYSQETLEKIKEVENNIEGGIVLNDERPHTIAERMELYHVKGASIAVISDYKMAWAKGYGWADEDEKRPITTETLFQPGSISKALNAVGILKLAQDKKVDLYTDINTYLTSWKFPYDSLSKGKKITLTHLLSHTAGLSTHGFWGHPVNGDIPTVLQILDGIKPAITSMRMQNGGLTFPSAVRSVFEPDLQYEYSGGGITISQLLLTDVTRQPYDTWMYDNVLKPIGMVNSFYAQSPPKNKSGLCASGFYRDGSKVLYNYHVIPEQAAGGLWMTPGDLCSYIIDMQLAYQGKPSKILSSEMVKLHLTPYNNGPTSLGSFIEDRNGSKYFQHAAGNDGFCGKFYGSLDDGNGVVVFLNSEDGQLVDEIINSVAKAYNWKNFYNEPQRKKTDSIIDVPESTFTKYEGIYVYDSLWTGVGKRDNGFYYYTMLWQQNAYTKIYFTSTTKFFNKEFGSVKEFVHDSNGNITGFTRTVNGKEYPNLVRVINPDTLKFESDVFADIGWYLFNDKKYKDALRYFKRGAELSPTDLNLQISMAHAYLFTNDYKNAIAIYKAHMNDTIKPDCSWEDMLRNDWIFFKDHHYDVIPFDKVFAELNIIKPKGY